MLTPSRDRGRWRKVKLERVQEVQDLLVPVLEQPAQAGCVHWTGIKLHGGAVHSHRTSIVYFPFVVYKQESLDRFSASCIKSAFLKKRFFIAAREPPFTIVEKQSI